MYLTYLSNKYLNTTKEEQDKQLDECYILNKKYSGLNLVKNVVKKRFSFSNYLNLFDKVQQVSQKVTDLEKSNQIL